MEKLVQIISVICCYTFFVLNGFYLAGYSLSIKPISAEAKFQDRHRVNQPCSPSPYPSPSSIPTINPDPEYYKNIN